MFNSGDLVMLSHQNIKTTCPSNKFDYWKLGPFKVINQISNNTYQLELPESLSRLHPVFNINLLEPYTLPLTFPDCIQQCDPVPEVVLETENVLKVKEIADVRKVGCHFDYLVEFLNKPSSKCSWIPLSNIPNNYNELLEWFHRQHASHPQPLISAFKAKTQNPIEHPTPSTPMSNRIPSPSAPSAPSPSAPSSSTSPPHDPLAHILQPTLPPDPDRFTYHLPLVMTMQSKWQSCPRNLDHITESIMSNTPQKSSVP